MHLSSVWNSAHNTHSIYSPQVNVVSELWTEGAVVGNTWSLAIYHRLELLKHVLPHRVWECAHGQFILRDQRVQLVFSTRGMGVATTMYNVQV